MTTTRRQSVQSAPAVGAAFAVAGQFALESSAALAPGTHSARTQIAKHDPHAAVPGAPVVE